MIQKGGKDFNKALLRVRNLERAKYLISKGANKIDESMRKINVSTIQISVYQYFISQGADVNKKIKGKNFLHHIVSSTCDLDAFKYIMEKSKKIF